MSTRLTVYTSVIGSRDRLRDEQAAGDAAFLAFVDRPWGSISWTERPAYGRFSSARRNARVPKILAHQFVDSPYSIWIDGSVALKVPAERLIDEWLGSADIAVFSHPRRRCTYDEATECARRGLDSPELIDAQMNAYSARGFPQGAGLAETTVVVRRHSARTEAFNNAWWSEVCRHSVRDQVSFMYSARRAGIEVNVVPGNLHRHPYLDVLSRPAEPETG